eukprot:5620319-Prymnesium_polylepis.1
MRPGPADIRLKGAAPDGSAAGRVVLAITGAVAPGVGVTRNETGWGVWTDCTFIATTRTAPSVG